MFLNNLFSRLKWEFSEQVEVRETFIQKLKWVKLGLQWSMSMTDKQRQVCFYRMFSDMTFEEIADKMKISKQTAHELFKNGINKGTQFIFDDENLTDNLI
jgi:DNA-directed RNA polymerase specialized sigma24 family protein